MATRKTINEKLEDAKLEKAQAEARIKELVHKQKAQERKARNHRLCERGGKLEKLLPELARLTAEQFEVFVEKCLLTSFTRRTLAELIPPETEQPDGDTVQADDSTATVTAYTEHSPKTSPKAHNSGANGNGKSSEAARVAG